MRMEKLTGKGDEHLQRHPNGMLYVRKFVTGKGELCRSTGTTDRMEARKIRNEFLAQFLNKDLAKVARKGKLRMTAGEYFNLFLTRKESANRRAATITSVKAAKKYFDLFLPSMFPEDITAAWWESEFIPKTRKIGFSKRDGSQIARTTDRKIFNTWKWMNSFLKQLHDDGVIEKTPKLINPDAKTSVGKVYTREEIENLLNFSSGDLHLAVLMASTMGMRKGEIVKLQWDRINFKNQTITLRPEDVKTGNKTGKGRTFVISATAFKSLALRATTAQSPFLFPNLNDSSRHADSGGFKTAWRTLKKNHGIVGRFHDLRHTFLTAAFKAPGANAALICHYAGVSLEEAARTYLHFTVEDSRGVAQLVSYE